jgi:hypothetical protein
MMCCCLILSSWVSMVQLNEYACMPPQGRMQRLQDAQTGRRLKQGQCRFRARFNNADAQVFALRRGKARGCCYLVVQAGV